MAARLPFCACFMRPRSGHKASFAESPENQAGVVGVIQNGTENGTEVWGAAQKKG